ncbi:MAG: hypothetical protein KC431_31755, partial [Myxococcales bacterium]|nr:hypothetical protein [Myxococcales bacterium]
KPKYFTFSADYENHDPSWAPVKATENGKLVLVSGLAELRKGAPFSSPQTVGTLSSHPAGGNLIFAGYHSRGEVRYDIKGGDIIVHNKNSNPSLGWLVVSSLLFATGGTQPLPLATGFHDYGKGFADASFTKEGD